MKKTTAVWNAHEDRFKKPCQADVLSAESDRVRALYQYQVLPGIGYLESEKDVSNKEGEEVLGHHIRTLMNVVMKEKLQVLGSEIHKNRGWLIKIILQECLFPSACHLAGMGGSKQSSLVGAITPQLRKEAFGLIEALVSNSSLNLKELLDTLKHIHFSGKLDFENYFPLKKRNVPVGLKNAGGTCYLNSLLQQLVMRPKVRNLIFSTKGNNDDHLEEENKLLKELKYTFAALLYGEEAVHFPFGILNKFRLHNQKSAYDNQDQECVGETFMLLLERLDSAMKGRGGKIATFDDLFQCTQSTITERSCGHYNEREEPTVMIPLVVRGKKGIQESLEAIVEPEDVRLECEICKTKKKMGKKQTKFKDLPNFLAFSLIRSGYDGTNKKIFDRYEFEEELDMKPYVAQEMETQSSPKPSKRMKLENGVDTFERELEEEDGKIDEERITSSTLYQLVGVIVHEGKTANSGHYIALVKDEDRKQWFNCDDDNVSAFDFENLENFCFGSDSDEEVVPTASFLIYERKSSHLPLELRSKRSRSAAFSPEFTSLTHPVDSTTHQAVLERNLKAISEVQKGEEEYIHFLSRVISGAIEGVLSRSSPDSSKESGKDSPFGKKNIMDFLVSFMVHKFFQRGPSTWKNSTHECLNNFLEWICNDEENFTTFLGQLSQAIQGAGSLRLSKFREFVVTKVMKRGIELLKQRREVPGPKDSVGLYSLVQTLVINLASEYDDDLELGYSDYLKLLFNLVEMYLAAFPCAAMTTLTKNVLVFLMTLAKLEDKFTNPILKLIWKLIATNCEPSSGFEHPSCPRCSPLRNITSAKGTFYQPVTIASVKDEEFMRMLIGSKEEEATFIAKHLSRTKLFLTVRLLYSIRLFLQAKLEERDEIKACDIRHAISMLEVVIGIEDRWQDHRYMYLVTRFFIPLLHRISTLTPIDEKHASAKMMCEMLNHFKNSEMFMASLSKEGKNFLEASSWVREVTRKRTIMGRLRKIIEELYNSIGIDST